MIYSADGCDEEGLRRPCAVVRCRTLRPGRGEIWAWSEDEDDDGRLDLGSSWQFCGSNPLGVFVPESWVGAGHRVMW